MNKRMAMVLLVVFALVQSFVAFAAYQGATVSEGATGSLTETTAGSDSAVGGNVTLINLTATVSTERWQGYYGNVSGTLRLGVGSNIFYDFSGASAAAVYASQNSSFDFTSLVAGTAAQVDTAWSYSTGSDQATDIYTGTATIESTTNVPVVELQPNGNGWYSGIFNDGNSALKSNFAFGANVSSTGATAFDGNTWQYQLMVPADGTAGETYYFFLSIA